MVRIALVDYSHMMVVEFKARAGESGPNDCGEAVLRRLSALRQEFDHVVVCLDSKPYWRTGLYPSYKSGRSEREPELVSIWRWSMDRLKSDGYSTAAYPENEADDVIATLSVAYAAMGHDVAICGADKDSCQLVNERVKLHVAKAGGWEVRDAEWVHKTHGVSPSDFALLQALSGDASDGIPGVKSWGAKRAAEAIKAYGTLNGIRKALAEKITSCGDELKQLPSIWVKFAEDSGKVDLYLKLTTLTKDLPLDAAGLLVNRPMAPLVQEDPIHPDGDTSGFETQSHSELEPIWNEIAEREALKVEELISPPPSVFDNRTMDATPEEEAAARQALREGRQPGTPPAVRREFVALGEALSDVPSQPTRKLESERPKEHAAAQNAAASSTPPATEPPAVGAVPSTPDPKVEVVDRPAPAPRKGDEITSMVLGERPAPPTWALALQPATASEALQIAKTLFNSRMYSQYGSERGVFATIMIGRELGLGIAASLESFHIVKDKPFMKAITLRALAERHPDCEWIMVTHADDKSATIKTKHRRIPEVLEYTYTAERADAAGYLTGANAANWKQKRPEMLEARATSKAVRRWYASATMGMHSEEEAHDD